MTDHELQPAEVYYGSGHSGELVRIRVPGGQLQFDDGSTAVVSVTDFPGLRIGGEYGLFLSRISGDVQGDRYQLAWGTQGAFELTSRRTVMPLGSVVAPIPRRFANESIADLVTATKTAAETARRLRGKRQH